MVLSVWYEELQQHLGPKATKQELYRAIVDSPFEHKVEVALLHLGIVVLLLVDPETKLINRIALSNTELAKGTTDISMKRFEDIKIPLDYPDNIIAKAIRTGKAQLTTDWKYLFAPALTPEEARFNQAGGAIACSAIYPLLGVPHGGAMIFSYYQYPEKLGPNQRKFMKSYSTAVAAALAA
jgi:hypothetical protein